VHETSEPSAERARTGGDAGTLAPVLAALAAGAGLIHLVMVPPHLAESTADGAGFIVAAVAQLGLAVALFADATRRVLIATVVVNVALVAAWFVSRTSGLPYGSHSGHPAEAAFIDLVCVGLELALVIGAAAVLLKPALGQVRLAVPGSLLAVVALVLAGSAIASPSARDHASASHGDHDAHGEEADGHAHGSDGTAADVDDGGLSLLVNGHQHGAGEEPLDDATQAALTAQLSRTSELVEAYPTVADAEAAGYRRAGPFSPGLGAHYQPPEYHLNPDGLIDGDDILHPFLIFDGIAPTSPIAGFMYMAYGTDGLPEGFAGPNDHWHHHERVCIVTNPDGQIDAPFGADIEGITDEQCASVGGDFIETTAYMVHVWTVPGYSSDRGVFGEVNPSITCPDGTYYQIDRGDIGVQTTTCTGQ
jgi:hypothetical protein